MKKGTIFTLFGLIVLQLVGCATTPKNGLARLPDVAYMDTVSEVLTKNSISPKPLYTLLDSLTKLNTLLDDSKLENEQLQEELDFFELDIEQLDFKIDSLKDEISAMQVASKINLSFKIPSSIEFAGRQIDLSSPRIYNKFYTIYQNELKMAHRYIPLSGYYFPYMESVFKKNSVPDDAKYLAVAESSLNPMAKSWAGAVGVWQFMPATAKQYGMKIDEFIDQRRDIRKSTNAAAYYLTDSRRYLKKYGSDDWLLAMASYNAGVGNIRKVILEQGGKSFDDLIMKADETNKYVWRAIAIKLIFQNQKEIFGKQFEKQKPLFEQMKSVSISLRGFHKIDKWAQAEGTSISKIWEHNHWINIFKTKRNRYSQLNNIILPPGEYSVLIPKDAKPDKKLLAQELSRFSKTDGENLIFYIVKKGDNLYDISRKYKTTVTKLKRINNLRKNTIYPGQKLKVYSLTQYTPSKTNIYTVVKGDSIEKIAKKLKVSANYLISLNKLDRVVLIHPGQKIKY